LVLGRNWGSQDIISYHETNSAICSLHAARECAARLAEQFKKELITLCAVGVHFQMIGFQFYRLRNKFPDVPNTTRT
jgi:hypothetical protein